MNPNRNNNSNINNRPAGSFARKASSSQKDWDDIEKLLYDGKQTLSKPPKGAFLNHDNNNNNDNNHQNIQNIYNNVSEESKVKLQAKKEFSDKIEVLQKRLVVLEAEHNENLKKLDIEFAQRKKDLNSIYSKQRKRIVEEAEKLKQEIKDTLQDEDSAPANNNTTNNQNITNNKLNNSFDDNRSNSGSDDHSDDSIDYIEGVRLTEEELEKVKREAVAKVIAKFDFAGNENSELSFKGGQKIYVLDKSDANGDGWWYGCVEETREVGYFPYEGWIEEIVMSARDNIHLSAPADKSEKLSPKTNAEVQSSVNTIKKNNPTLTPTKKSKFGNKFHPKRKAPSLEQIEDIEISEPANFAKLSGFEAHSSEPPEIQLAKSYDPTATASSASSSPVASSNPSVSASPASSPVAATVAPSVSPGPSGLADHSKHVSGGKAKAKKGIPKFFRKNPKKGKDDEDELENILMDSSVGVSDPENFRFVAGYDNSQPSNANASAPGQPPAAIDHDHGGAGGNASAGAGTGKNWRKSLRNIRKGGNVKKNSSEYPQSSQKIRQVHTISEFDEHATLRVEPRNSAPNTSNNLSMSTNNSNNTNYGSHGHHEDEAEEDDDHDNEDNYDDKDNNNNNNTNNSDIRVLPPPLGNNDVVRQLMNQSVQLSARNTKKFDFNLLSKNQNLWSEHGLDRMHLEDYITDESFRDGFGMSKEEFVKLPALQQSQLKRERGLW